MTKIDIFSGFLGAGKTTLIKKLIAEAYRGEKLVLIENEFGQIGIDSAFLQEADIEVTEMNSGCICCSLVGDFGEALLKVLEKFSPDRIIIEPSGVGKLSDVIKAVETSCVGNAVLNSSVTVVDASRCKMYMKNFGEFFGNQIENAKCIVLSHTQSAGSEKTETAISLIRTLNKDALIISTEWEKLDGKDIVSSIENSATLKSDLEHLTHEHHHEHSEHCDCGHHHEHGEHCDCGEHHHHEHGEHCDCGHHHHHHAEDVFTSWGKETSIAFTKEKIQSCLDALSDFETYGTILRAKGVVEGENGEWIHFDYVPDFPDIRNGSAFVTGRICVIGKDINEENLQRLFEI